MTRLIALFIIVALTLAISQRTSSQALVPTISVFGQTVNGLRIGIATVSRTQPPRDAAFVLTLENTGETDFVVNLGAMLANGKVMFPSNVRLRLIDPSGRTRELEFSDRHHPGVAGRLDDFTVALRRKASIGQRTLAAHDNRYLV